MSEGTAPGATGARGILVTHGNMAAGMLDATRKIAGAPADSLVAVSNETMGPEDLVRAVSDVAGDTPAIIFTDLQTGSCALAARFVCRNPVGRRVIFGVNLPMLLDFVFHRHLPLDELVERLVERGRSAIRSQTSEVGERGDRPVPR